MHLANGGELGAPCSSCGCPDETAPDLRRLLSPLGGRFLRTGRVELKCRSITRTKRFLVVDDQPLARESLRAIAQTAGAFSVDFAPGYQDAIFKIRNNCPDVILCDYISAMAVPASSC